MSVNGSLRKHRQPTRNMAQLEIIFTAVFSKIMTAMNEKLLHIAFHAFDIELDLNVKGVVHTFLAGHYSKPANSLSIVKRNKKAVFLRVVQAIQ